MSANALLPPLNFTDTTAQNPEATGSISGPGAFNVNYGTTIPQWVWLLGGGLAALFIIKKVL